MSDITDYDLRGDDLIITDKFAKQATVDLILLVDRQRIDAIVRDLVKKLAPDQQVVNESHDVLEACLKPEECSVKEPHKHASYRYRIVPKAELAQMMEDA